MPAADQDKGHSGQPSAEAIRDQLDRITGSGEFDTGRRSKEFLRFVVGETLDGRSEEISQHAIAMSVFDRDPDFDPGIDPIVRIQAGRVRRSLEHYYLTAGASDPVLIGLPKGTYGPTFCFRAAAGNNSNKVSDHGNPSREPWPTLLVTPLRNLTGSDDAEFIAVGLASDLAAELGRDKAIQVFLAPSSEEDCAADFKLSGTVTAREDEYKINLHLTVAGTGRQQWAESYLCPTDSRQGATLDMLVQSAVSTITEERGVVSEQFARQAVRRSEVVGVGYEGILRHHHFEATHTEQAFSESLEALGKAVAIDPDCALCWTYLARLGAIHWSLGAPGDAIPIEDSIAAARRGARLAPRDVRSRVILAYVLMVSDGLEEARTEAEMALELCGASVFWLDAVGYLLTLLGEWNKGPKLMREAMQVNPFPRRACYNALWLDAFHRGNLEVALAYAREDVPEAYFWAPLIEAATLVELKRFDEARSAVDRLLAIKPHFPRHARWLINRYVKFPDLAARIEGAFEAAAPTAAEAARRKSRATTGSV